MAGVRFKDTEREFFIDNLLARIHSSIVMIRWTGLAPLEFEFPFPGSLKRTVLVQVGFLTTAGDSPCIYRPSPGGIPHNLVNLSRWPEFPGLPEWM